jgi:hypothetical protein
VKRSICLVIVMSRGESATPILARERKAQAGRPGPPPVLVLLHPYVTAGHFFSGQ